MKAVIISFMGRPGGMIDLHAHGMGRHDTRGPAPDIRALARAYGKAGVSGFLPTIYPGHIENMRLAMARVKDAISLGHEPGSARILGVNLEGPFLNAARSGALDGKSFIPRPRIPDIKRLIAGFEDIVRIITIAPELSGALGIIEHCAGRGIRVNMGHSDATYKQAMEGKLAGATGITHLFNAMRPMHHREPGLIGLGLMDDDLYVEIIPDGIHLSPEIVRMVFRMKPAERILAVSDSVRGPHMKGDVLQGSAITLKDGYERMIGMGISQRAASMATRTNPVRYLAV